MVSFFMVGCQHLASNSNGKPSLQFRLSNRGGRECPVIPSVQLVGPAPLGIRAAANVRTLISMIKYHIDPPHFIHRIKKENKE